MPVREVFETEGTVEQCARMILWRKAQKAWTTGVVEATKDRGPGR